MLFGTPLSPNRAIEAILSLHISPLPFPPFSSFFPLILDLSGIVSCTRAPRAPLHSCMCACSHAPIRWCVLGQGSNPHTPALFSPLSPFAAPCRIFGRYLTIAAFCSISLILLFLFFFLPRYANPFPISFLLWHVHNCLQIESLIGHVDSLIFISLSRSTNFFTYCMIKKCNFY